MSDKEKVLKELEEAYRRLFSLRLQWMTRQVSNYRSIKQARRDIARLKTIQRERELAAQAVAKEE
jgi:large subunit ribosomal protein L29